MNTKEKLDLILLELYTHKFDGQYYDITTILTKKVDINSTLHEAYDLRGELEGRGLIQSIKSMGKNIDARINASGVQYIEENMLSLDRDDAYFTTKEIEDLKIRLDEFADQLKRLEIGIQITYDDLLEEIEELKELLERMNKKNWGEVFRGKLVKFGLGYIADKIVDLISDIFKDNNLMLGN